MSLFCCSKCGCVEDTALCRYWSARVRQMPLVCSLCDPAIGHWHDQFPRRSADGWFKGERGAIVWNKSEVEDWLGTPIEVLGKPTPSTDADAKPIS
jgi:hypothetical protein